MEEILKQLQAIQIEAFKMKVSTFDITTYHYDDTPGGPGEIIIVRASKIDYDYNVLYVRIYSDRLDSVPSIITRLKLYLGL